MKKINQLLINPETFSSVDIDNYKLLLLKNGGKDLSAIEKQFRLLTINNKNRRQLEHCN